MPDMTPDLDDIIARLSDAQRRAIRMARKSGKDYYLPVFRDRGELVHSLQQFRITGLKRGGVLNAKGLALRERLMEKSDAG